MKALSIRQPYAWLIAEGFKDVENRSWTPRNPNLRFRGKFLIHAAKAWFPGFIQNDIGLAELVAAYEKKAVFPATKDFMRGGIIGEAEIIDVVYHSSSLWFSGPVGLVIANAKPLPFFPCNGQLGFFDVVLP